MRRTIRVAVAVGAAMAIAIVGAATASAGTKIEHFSFMTTTATNGYTAIATGAFTDGGAALLQVPQGAIKLQRGTIKLAIKVGKPSESINLKACLGVSTQPGTYKVVGGTGAYKGIAGSGSFVAHYTEVGKIVNGKCSKTAKPVASEGIITASGPVTMG
jgi:hypothetical protein